VSERRAALLKAFTNLSLLSATGRVARHGQDLVVPTSSTLSTATDVRADRRWIRARGHREMVLDQDRWRAAGRRLS